MSLLVQIVLVEQLHLFLVFHLDEILVPVEPQDASRHKGELNLIQYLGMGTSNVGGLSHQSHPDWILQQDSGSTEAEDDPEIYRRGYLVILSGQRLKPPSGPHPGPVTELTQGATMAPRPRPPRPPRPRPPLLAGPHSVGCAALSAVTAALAVSSATSSASCASRTSRPRAAG
jgi:hypothetical protein